MEQPNSKNDLFDKASALHLQDRFEEAEQIYVHLLEQNHDNPGLMATLGSLYFNCKRYGLAIHFLEMAKKLDIPDIYTNLGLAYQQSGQYWKARENLEKSIQNNPTPEALTNYSGMFIEIGESKKCAALCEQAIAMNPDLTTAHWNLAISLLGDGVWDRAWDEHEWGLKIGGLREDRQVVDVPRWDGTQDKTVLIYGEQGLGDEIMFASMLPDILKTNKVVLECHQRLETLFKKSFPEIPVYGTREDKLVAWAGDHPIDYRLSIGSLGKFYRRSIESFPGTAYLKAEPLPKAGKFRVGISWIGGGQKQGRVQKRSIPLLWWKSLLKVPDVEFVSLQYTDSKEEMDLMGALGFDIQRMDGSVKARDYYETAKLVASCDLVISICTSVVHLAGALGVPCWCATPHFPAWRYQNEGKMPWYRSVSLYRSPEVSQDGWFPVIAKMTDDLQELVGKKKTRLERVA